MNEIIDVNVSAELKSVAAAIEALGNETRLSVYTLLVPSGRSGLTVGDIQEKLAIPASTLSHHISRLMHVHLVEQERRGRKLICRANYRRMEGVLSFLTRNCCVDETKLSADQHKEARYRAGTSL